MFRALKGSYCHSLSMVHIIDFYFEDKRHKPIENHFAAWRSFLLKTFWLKNTQHINIFETNYDSLILRFMKIRRHGSNPTKGINKTFLFLW